jgi:uncharacterized protein with von Willebrand factor type A (vWA) domain
VSDAAAGLTTRLSALAAGLRAAGVTVGVSQVLTAHRALAAGDPASRAGAFVALRAVFCSSPADIERFERVFAATFGTDGALDAVGPPPEPLPRRGTKRTAEPARGSVDVTPRGPRLPRTAVPGEERPDGSDPADDDLVPAPHSDVELLRRKDFAEYTDEERAVAQRLLDGLVHRAPLRPARRSRTARRRTARLDHRAILRRSLALGGEPIELRWRARVHRPRRLVFVLDVSGSMAPYARMLAQYVHAWVVSPTPVEAFVFSTRLTRVTRELAEAGADAALERAAARAPDWAGGTRIGAAIAGLNRRHARHVGRGSVVVIVSDGWELGDPDELGREMARLRRCAHRVLWLNPLAGDPRYEPLTRGMVAALPSTDRLLPADSIAALEELARMLESVLCA